MSKLSVFSLVVIIAMVFAFQLPELASAQAGPVSSKNDDIHDGMRTVLTAPYAPHAGQVIELTFQVTPYFEATDLQVQWKVEGGAELIGPPTETFPQAAARQSLTSTRQVLFPTNGDYKIAATASYSLGSAASFSSPGILWFKIDRLSASTFKADPDAVKPWDVKGLESSYEMPDAPEIPNDCINVNGRVTRRDRVVSASNPRIWGSTPVIPVPHALVRLREEDTFFDDNIADVITNANGEYSFTACGLDDGWFDNELEIYVRLRAELHDGGPSGINVVEVEDSSWIDETYEYDTSIWSTYPSGSHTFDFHLEDDTSWSAIFNIADTIFEARRFWNESNRWSEISMNQAAEVHWETGYGQEVSKFIWALGMDEISISDSPDPDEYDDGVILHEWNHFAEHDHYCTDTWGGAHTLDGRVDPELAYSEGYGDFFPSAYRDVRGLPWPSWYIDNKDIGVDGSAYNLEDWNTAFPNSVFYNNEMSLAAALWDLIDTPADGQERADFEYWQLQKLNSWDEWQHQPGIDDHCHIMQFTRYWARMGLPTTAGVAAAFNQNIGRQIDFGDPLMPHIPGTPDQATVPTEYNYNWWDRVAFLVDNSQSMNSDNKLSSVKTVLNQAVDTLAAEPQGAEFELWTFSNESTANQELFSGIFIPDDLHPGINSLSTTSSGDPLCYVEGFRALAQMTELFGNADLWLFTDGYTYDNLPPAEAMTRMLQDKELRASIAMLGGCSTLAPEGTAKPSAADAAVRRSYKAAARSLGIPTDGVEDGILPYLIVSAQSGGQFLYVSPSQLDAASDVLLSQITHSAGAGRWSDYVSDTATYRYDPLASWEYNWIDATSGGSDWGKPPDNGYLDGYVGSVPYFGSYYSMINAYENGYIILGTTGLANQTVNGPLPSTALPNNAVYPFWDDLWSAIPGMPGMDGPVTNGKQAPDGATGHIWVKTDGAWLAVQYKDFFWMDGVNPVYIQFETLFNTSTGEIRFLYNSVPGGAPWATIGIENSTGTTGVQISRDTATGASSGSGYKLTPAPAQPTKTYDVAVDSTMSSIGFLLTGFSGDFDKLAVHDSDGKDVSCSDPGVTCVDAGRVQYLQAPVNDRFGTWDAVVSAGPSGGGTFSFSSFSISAVDIEDTGEHTISTGASLPLYIDLGQTTDDMMLQGDFKKPDGSGCGSKIYLYDDGLHDDLEAKDGAFGSAAYSPECTGSAYLQLTGVMTDTTFVRVDPKPYQFNPARLEFLSKEVANYGAASTISYYIHNDDDVDHTFLYDIQLPPNWWTSTAIAGSEVFVNAHSNKYGSFQVYMGAGTTNALASGASGEVVLTVFEKEQGEITASDSATLTRRRAPSTLVFEPNASYLRPYDTVPLLVYINDDQGYPVEDGLQIDLYVTPPGSGSLPASAITSNGLIAFEYTAGGDVGDVLLTAQYNGPLSAPSGGPSGSYTIPVQNPDPHTIDLSATDHQLPGDGTAQTGLTATVLDSFGSPVKSVEVQICVLGDEDQDHNPAWGMVDYSWCVTKSTDENGVVQATFTAGYIHGIAKIAAQVAPSGDPKYQQGVIEDMEQIRLVWHELFLPVELRQ